MFLQGFFSKDDSIYRFYSLKELSACLKVTLHQEIILDWECVVHGIIQNPSEKDSILCQAGFCYCYNVKLVMVEELFSVLYRTIFKRVLYRTKYNTFSIDLKPFYHTKNPLSMQIVLWVFMVLYRTTDFIKEAWKNVFKSVGSEC